MGNVSEIRKVKLLVKPALNPTPPWGTEETVSWLSCPQSVVTLNGAIYFMTTDDQNPDNLFLVKHVIATGVQTTIYTYEVPGGESFAEPTHGFFRNGTKIYLVLFNNSRSFARFFLFQNDALVRTTLIVDSTSLYINYEMRNIAIGADDSINVIYENQAVTNTLINYRSTDDGATWTPITIAVINPQWSFTQAIYKDATTNDLYVASEQRNLAYTNHYIKIYKSTDNGTTWALVSTQTLSANLDRMKDFYTLNDIYYLVYAQASSGAMIILKSTDASTFTTIATIPSSTLSARFFTWLDGSLGIVVISGAVYKFYKRINDVSWVQINTIPNLDTINSSDVQLLDSNSGVLVFTAYYMNTLIEVTGIRYMAFGYFTEASTEWNIIPVKFVKNA